MASDREALRKLANEVTAVIAMAEPELRHVCGHTNFALLTQRRDEAYAALAAPTAVSLKHRCSGCGHRWEIGTSAELCGDCWRKAQPVVHAAPPSAPHDYAALANRLADFRFGSALKPDGTERDPKEWLAFEPELMRALRDLAAPPSAQEGWQDIATAPKDAVPYVTSGTLVLVTDGANYACLYGSVAGDESTDWDGSKHRYTHWRPLPPPPAGAPRT